MKNFCSKSSVSKMRIVADDAIPLFKGVLENVLPSVEIQYLPGSSITAADVQNADALFVRTRTKCNRELLEKSNVQFIATATIGTDHFDEKFLKEKGIYFTNAPGCNAASVCDYWTAALLEMCVKYGKRFSDLTLGVVGVGNIGSRIAKRAKAFGMRVLCSDPPREARGDLLFGTKEDYVSLRELYRKANVITFHTPLVREGLYRTDYLFDASSVSELQVGVWVFNMARGGVVSEEALERALQAKVCGGAVLDVFENEPNISRQILNAVDFSTPHIAGYSLDGKANATTAVIQSFAQFFDIPKLQNFQAKISNIAQPVILNLAKGLSDESALLQIFKTSYDISKDSEMLRVAPELFEKFRKEYAVRREPFAHSLKIKGASKRVLELARFVGFQIMESVD